MPFTTYNETLPTPEKHKCGLAYYTLNGVTAIVIRERVTM